MIKNQKDELQGKDAEPDLKEIGHIIRENW